MNIIFAATCNSGGAAGSGLINSTSLPKTCASQSTLNSTLTIVFVIIGALAFLMLVVAGLRYVLSGGNTEQTASARRQIIYSLIGLIVAASAAAIVNFILKKL